MDLYSSLEPIEQFELKEVRQEPSTARLSLSPPVVVEKISSHDRQFYVVRDDLLPGGSKQRACYPFLYSLAEKGFSTFYYASPFAGFAQVALAYTCNQMGLRCRIYCEMDVTQRTEFSKHEFTLLAEKFGAEIILTRSLSEAEVQCAKEAQKSSDVVKIPLGFNCHEFKSEFEKALREQWLLVKIAVGKTPMRVWLPVGSGTLTSVFDRVLETQILINCVNVRILTDCDSRIQALLEKPRITMFSTPETFHRKAEIKPVIPSNVHYDAKIWQFLSTHGENGDVWWNVAR